MHSFSHIIPAAPDFSRSKMGHVGGNLIVINLLKIPGITLLYVGLVLKLFVV